MELLALRKKKIAIAGYGREGRSLAVFFRKRDIRFTVLDQNPAALLDLPADVPRVSGPDYLKSAADFDLVYKSPGIPRLNQYLLRAESAGAKLSSPTALFLSLCPCPVVGITGTKGKSTTASLLTEMFLAQGREVFLGGNIGIPILDFLEQLTEQSWVILELSSFQLQDLEQSPQFAVFLNFSPDHLNHHANEREYLEAKINILKYQKPNDFAVLNADSETVRGLAVKTLAQKFWFSVEREVEPGAQFLEDELVLNFGGKLEKLCPRSSLKLRGLHNVQNALAACALAKCAGVNTNAIKKALTAFSGLPHHRLEYAGSVGKIMFYNDSLATNPAATMAAIASFKEAKVMILGGVDKGLKFESLASAITKANVKAVVVVGEVKDKLIRSLNQAGFLGNILAGGNTMREIVAKAYCQAGPDDVVLLSPAAASIDMFKSYEARGEEFIREVKKLQDDQKKSKKK